MSKPNRPIEEGWLSYMQNVVNPRNSAAQIAEMRRVFYAGAMISAVACLRVVETANKDDALAQLHAVHSDIESFQEELRPKSVN